MEPRLCPKCQNEVLDSSIQAGGKGTQKVICLYCAVGMAKLPPACYDAAYIEANGITPEGAKARNDGVRTVSRTKYDDRE